MMLNQLPQNAPMSDVLAFIENKSERHGKRDRCLYVVRQQLRLADIANFSVSSVVNLDASIRRFITANDGKRFDLSVATQAELKRYIQKRFGLKSLEDLTPEQAALSLFPTQKSAMFTPNTIAQHLSYLDRAVRESFVEHQKPLERASERGHSYAMPNKNKSLLSRFAASLS